jgi:hypothetical protein
VIVEANTEGDALRKVVTTEGTAYGNIVSSEKL